MSKDIKTAEELAENLELLLEALVANTQSTDINLERLSQESLSHKEDLKRLLRVVVDGNGQAPILTRIALLEQKATDTRDDLEKFKSRWWQLVIATLPGILAAVVGVSTVM